MVPQNLLDWTTQDEEAEGTAKEVDALLVVVVAAGDEDGGENVAAVLEEEEEPVDVP